MNQTVLTIEQMDHLRKIGLSISKASMKFISIYPSYNYGEGDKCEFIPVDCRFDSRIYNEHGNTFTFQDILNILPKVTLMRDKDSGQAHQCLLSINLGCNSISYGYDVYGNNYAIVVFEGIDLVNSAYEMLCWCAENRYLSKIHYND